MGLEATRPELDRNPVEDIVSRDRAGIRRLLAEGGVVTAHGIAVEKTELDAGQLAVDQPLDVRAQIALEPIAVRIARRLRELLPADLPRQIGIHRLAQQPLGEPIPQLPLRGHGSDEIDERGIEEGVAVLHAEGRRHAIIVVEEHGQREAGDLRDQPFVTASRAQRELAAPPVGLERGAADVDLLPVEPGEVPLLDGDAEPRAQRASPCDPSHDARRFEDPV